MREDLPVLVLFDGWTSYFRDRVVPWRIAMAAKTRAQFENEVLPGYITPQRWYAAKGEPVTRAGLADHLLWERDGREWMLGLFEVESGAGAGKVPYFIPLALDWEDGGSARSRERTPATIAKTRQQANVGMLTDAFFDETFCRALAQAIGAGGEVATAQGQLRFVPTASFAALAGDAVAKLAVQLPAAQSSNTVTTLGDRLFLKGYRRLRPGVNPEFEMGRFLTEVAHFANCVPVAGAVEYVGADGSVMTLAMLQGYVSNQGDGWNFTLEYLERHFADAREPLAGPDAGAHGTYCTLMRTLGERIGGLHRALTRPGGGAAFDAEELGAGDVAAWKSQVRSDALATLDLLGQRAGGLDPGVRAAAAGLLGERRRLIARIEGITVDPAGSKKQRFHGDLHLGQVLLRNNDFVIIDFEGEPARSLEERRAKHSPLRDVAGMLRSFDYARSSALRRAGDDAGTLGRCRPLVDAWHDAARAAFLDGYAAVGEGAGLWSSFDAVHELIALFEIEKALYELRYELNHRPGWATIPIAGLSALAAGATGR